ncbi:hypothetical protein BH09VER1_BH09VER1_44080 [soil metagenome]
MEFRPQQYDYHRRKPSYYQWERRQRVTLFGLIAAPVLTLGFVVYFVILHHR